MKKQIISLCSLTVLTATTVWAACYHIEQKTCPDTYTPEGHTNACNIVTFGSKYDSAVDGTSAGKDGKKGKKTPDCLYDCMNYGGGNAHYGEELTGNSCNTGG